MIIKGLFRRHKRWNPVHPTYGAFWGMGIGIGCGVGWGPGFGPEVVGYVGAGCGIGFSMGITLAGIGVGLPANYRFRVPYNAFLTTRAGALEYARTSGLLPSKLTPDLGWNTFASHVSVLQREATSRLLRILPLQTSSIIQEGLENFNTRIFHHRRDKGADNQ